MLVVDGDVGVGAPACEFQFAVLPWNHDENARSRLTVICHDPSAGTKVLILAKSSKPIEGRLQTAFGGVRLRQELGSGARWSRSWARSVPELGSVRLGSVSGPFPRSPRMNDTDTLGV